MSCAVRSAPDHQAFIALVDRYAADLAPPPDDETALVEKLRAGELTAAELLAGYCGLLYPRLGTYAEVAKRTGLDPRTSRKYIESARPWLPSRAISTV